MTKKVMTLLRSLGYHDRQTPLLLELYFGYSTYTFILLVASHAKDNQVQFVSIKD
jgi:hypothetical protein